MDGSRQGLPAYLFSRPVSYASSSRWIISLRVYLPALDGILRRMSGRAGSMGRMNVGIFSYIACTPAMISVASFSSIPFPFDFDLLLVLIVLTACLVRVPKLHHITSSRLVQDAVIGCFNEASMLCGHL